MDMLRSSLVLLPFLVACGPQGSSNWASPAEIAASAAAAAAAASAAEEAAKVAEAREREEKTADCKKNISSKLAEYRQLMTKREYGNAALVIRECSELLNEPKLHELVTDGEIKSHYQDLDNPTQSVFNKIQAIEALQRDYPEHAKKNEKRLAASMAYLQREREAKEQQRRLDSTPPLGISTQEVISSYWGYPTGGINRTTSARGTTEQWVYGNGRYLYFDNGRLTTVQEGR
ncbi:hypothetical protein [Azohydromonas australica]|uniref:hypothetical protein n=1 Tax=Azohydromonas australica TaxID=364039 RepID=UPI0012EBCFEB|nr:hypothetical protein [Azohydromonas australica]